MVKFVNLRKRELNLLIACCIIIIVALSYIIIIEPFARNYKGITEEVREKEAHFFKLKKSLLYRDSAENMYAELAPLISQTGSDEERFALFMKEVELISRRSNIYITTLKPISVLKVDKYKKYMVAIEAEGEITALVSFLYNLPQSSQVIGLKQVQINYSNREEDILQFKLNLERMVLDEAEDEK
ncbi:MAG: hypothetical protein ABH836_07915 [Candidatus Omnitrophota bacterium]